MEPSSTSFDTLVRTHHQRLSRVVVKHGDVTVEDTYYDGTKLSLDSESSNVSYDRVGDTRAAANIGFFLETDDAEELVDPLIYPEIEVYEGIMVDGSPEWIQMGVFGITNLSAERTGTRVRLSVTATDRSARIRDNVWPAPYSVASGTDYFAAAAAIITDRAKGFTPSFNLGSSVLTTPALIFTEDEDPWGTSIMKLAEAVGCEAYFDRQGAFTMLAIQDPSTIAPAIELFQDDTNGILISPTTRETSNRDVYNGVICRGEAPWLLFPVRGEIWDDDPLSPTYRLGTFGERPKKIGDALATTDAQCLAIATADFKKTSGVVEQITFNFFKDPRLNVGDVIALKDEYLSITGRYVLDQYNYPLGSSAASGMVRRKR